MFALLAPFLLSLDSVSTPLSPFMASHVHTLEELMGDGMAQWNDKKQITRKGASGQKQSFVHIVAVERMIRSDLTVIRQEQTTCIKKKKFAIQDRPPDQFLSTYVKVHVCLAPVFHVVDCVTCPEGISEALK